MDLYFIGITIGLVISVTILFSMFGYMMIQIRKSEKKRNRDWED